MLDPFASATGAQLPIVVADEALRKGDSPYGQIRELPDPRKNEPVNTALNATTQRHAVAIGRVTPDTACAAPDPKQQALLDANAKVADEAVYRYGGEAVGWFERVVVLTLRRSI